MFSSGNAVSRSVWFTSLLLVHTAFWEGHVQGPLINCHKDTYKWHTVPSQKAICTTATTETVVSGPGSITHLSFTFRCNRLLEYDELQVLVTHSTFGINSGRNLEMPGELYEKKMMNLLHISLQYAWFNHLEQWLTAWVCSSSLTVSRPFNKTTKQCISSGTVLFKCILVSEIKQPGENRIYVDVNGHAGKRYS